MDAKKLAIEAAQLSRLELATALWNLVLHEVLPFSLVTRDHVDSGHKVAIEFTGGAGLRKPASQCSSLAA